MNNSHILEHNLYQRNNIFKSFSNVEDVLNKGGEGSKGGKVIGHTKSGKPVYRNHTVKNKVYKDFTKQDHADASKLHRKECDSTNSFKREAHHSKREEQHLGEATDEAVFGSAMKEFNSKAVKKLMKD